jgi:hypothetical protein
LSIHRGSDLGEAGNVGTSNKRWELTLCAWNVFLGGLEAVLESSLHDALELVVDLLAGPLQTSRVLGHLETGDGDTTSIGSLTC